jgi:molybdopterin converting factor small subunit
MERMRVKLIIFASGGMGAPIGEPETVIELPDGSVLQDLLDSFLEKYGRDLIGGSEDYQRHYLFNYMCVSVNSKFISNDKAREVYLHDNDSVIIIPIITGG